MYVNENNPNVMPGEPQLGTIDESELVIKKEEVVWLLAKTMEEEGMVPDVLIGEDENTGEEILIERREWITKPEAEELEEWLNDLAQDDKFPSEEECQEKIEKIIGRRIASLIRNDEGKVEGQGIGIKPS